MAKEEKIAEAKKLLMGLEDYAVIVDIHVPGTELVTIQWSYRDVLAAYKNNATPDEPLYITKAFCEEFFAHNIPSLEDYSVARGNEIINDAVVSLLTADYSEIPSSTKVISRTLSGDLEIDYLMSVDEDIEEVEKRPDATNYRKSCLDALLLV